MDSVPTTERALVSRFQNQKATNPYTLQILTLRINVRSETSHPKAGCFMRLIEAVKRKNDALSCDIYSAYLK